MNCKVWAKIDAGYSENIKAASVGPIGQLIHFRSILYAVRNLTDGIIPRSAISLLTHDLEFICDRGEPVLEKNFPCLLVTHGLWEVHDQGYYIHDFLKWNRSKKEVIKLTKNRSFAGKKGMESRYNQTNSTSSSPNKNLTSDLTSVITNAYQPVSVSVSESVSTKVKSRKRDERQISDVDRPTEKHIKLAQQFRLDVDYEWAQFSDYCRSVGRKYADFEAAFSNSLRRSAERKGTLQLTKRKGLPEQMSGKVQL